MADGARVLAIWHLINKVKFSSIKCRVHIVVSTAKIPWIRVYGYTYFPWAYMASSHTCQVNWLFFACERGKILHECMV